MSDGANPATCFGNTVTMPGEDRKCSALHFDCSIMTATARRIGASWADSGAGSGRSSNAPGSLRRSSAPGKTNPLATTNEAILSAKASNTPDSASAVLWVSSVHSLPIRAAASSIVAWLRRFLYSCEIIRLRELIFAEAKTRSASCVSRGHCSWLCSGIRSAIVFRSRRMGRQNESGQSGDENMESKVWGILLANSGVRNVGPPAQYSQCLSWYIWTWI